MKFQFVVKPTEKEDFVTVDVSVDRLQRVRTMSESGQLVKDEEMELPVHCGTLTMKKSEWEDFIDVPPVRRLQAAAAEVMAKKVDDEITGKDKVS